VRGRTGGDGRAERESREGREGEGRRREG